MITSVCSPGNGAVTAPGLRRAREARQRPDLPHRAEFRMLGTEHSAETREVRVMQVALFAIGPTRFCPHARALQRFAELSHRQPRTAFEIAAAASSLHDDRGVLIDSPRRNTSSRLRAMRSPRAAIATHPSAASYSCSAG